MLKVEPTTIDRMIEDDLDSMMFEHWEESALDTDEIKFDPDWEYARWAEKEGILKIFGLISDGQVVGYNVYEVATCFHFKKTLQAFNSGVYVRKEFRKGFNGMKLIRESERLLEEIGVARISYTVPMESSIDVLLERAGHKRKAVYFSRLVHSGSTKGT